MDLRELKGAIAHLHLGPHSYGASKDSPAQSEGAWPGFVKTSRELTIDVVERLRCLLNVDAASVEIDPTSLKRERPAADSFDY